MHPTNCNMSGNCANAILECLRPDIDLYIFRDIYDPDASVIYSGEASNFPNLRNYHIIDMQYDSYNCIFFVEVE